ncbi:MAG: transcriptional regulator [Candidatus Eisenbacteria bacterium]|nr:transcriptional regulator [Candidatus Eisenbacteria bacterium]
MSRARAQGSVQALLNLDRLVHEPARLVILTVLSGAAEVEFKFLEATTGLTRGNLSSHVSKLEAAGYLDVHKSFRARLPVTSYRITASGRRALADYLEHLRGALPRQGKVAS